MSSSLHHIDTLLPREENHLALYVKANRYINQEIVRLIPRRRDYPEKIRLARQFFDAIGNPQRCAPAIQVAGTSGKGTTSYFIARMLKANGFKTALHVSPYLQVATEKTWVDGLYASGRQFHDVLETLRPEIERLRKDDDLPVSVHGLASLSTSLEIFRQESPDWLVMETGLGGRYDLIQGLDRRLGVITDIGFDHMESLGHSLEEIAWHKAGILENCPVAVAVYNPKTWPVLEAEARRFKCRLVPLDLPRPETAGGGKNDTFVHRNQRIALAAMELLADQGVSIDLERCRLDVAQARFPGRLERMQSDPEVILDGAHNPQKMNALVRSIPDLDRQPLILLFGITGARSASALLESLPVAPRTIVLCQPHLLGKEVPPPDVVVGHLSKRCSDVRVEDRPEWAVELCIDLARQSQGRVLATGSLYTIGSVRNVWFPWESVLLNRCSW